MEDSNINVSEEAASSNDPPFVNLRYLSKVGFVVKRVVHTWPTEKELAASGEEPYHLDAPQSLDHLDFVPQPMVGWYRPSELIKTGTRSVIAAIFGSYADKREIESVLTKEEWHDYSKQVRDQDGLWIDYVADLGDGWDSTYTMARLLAEKNLEITYEGKTEQIPRGHILVMGGDEIYPTATREEYENRMVHPYRCALPFVEYSEQASHLYLIPGNHDWYDGLNNFFKLFCQKGWIGGWRMWQRRSYFALKLDHKLWLWGIDIQLNSNIDKPQLDYFNHLAIEQMEPGSKIILCTAEPSWVYVEAKTMEKKAEKKKKAQVEIYRNLGHLEKWAIKPNGHEVIIGLAGDWHNYTRYERKGTTKDGTFQASDKNHQRFVSGGGGAYLYPTHNMPERLEIPNIPDPRGPREVYKREKVFPSLEDSKKLANRSLLFPFFRLNWYFTAFLGAFYLLLAWIIQSVSKIANGSGNTLLDKFYNEGIISYNAVTEEITGGLMAFINVIAHSPESVMFLLVLVFGLVAFSSYKTPWKKAMHGGLHGLTHVALLLGLIYVIAWFNLGVLDLKIEQPLQGIIFGIAMLGFGGFVGSLVFGFYLWFSNKVLGIHDNEVLLCQSHPDYKNFLRFHIKDGKVTIYPIGVRRVNRKRGWKHDKTNLDAWELQTEAKGGASWFEPKKGKIRECAHLIEEKPIVVTYNDDRGSAP